MRNVKTPWEVLPKFYLLGFGIPLSVIGLLFLVFNGSWALMINGVIWLVIGIACVTKNRCDRQEHSRLKEEGLCYTGTVTKICPNHFVRIGSYITARVICSYIGETGAATVNSNHFLLTHFDKKENFRAMVYVDQRDASKFFVDLYRMDE